MDCGKYAGKRFLDDSLDDVASAPLDQATIQALMTLAVYRDQRPSDDGVTEVEDELMRRFMFDATRELGVLLVCLDLPVPSTQRLLDAVRSEHNAGEDEPTLGFWGGILSGMNHALQSMPELAAQLKARRERLQ